MEHIAGRYRIIDELGRGGMGAVYRAQDRVNGRLVALKTLTCEGENARLTRLFEREYHTLASLQHPSVIEVHDFGISAQGQRFYTMELLEGEELSKLAPLPYPQVCAHLRDVAMCLALLHARRLLHRDVSPRNVRLDALGRAKLLDFGALGDFGIPRELVGTPAYMAAETVHRMPLDQRSDLFSLGGTLFFMLTGRPPFLARRLDEIEHAQRTEPPPPSQLIADIPSALDQLVLALLSLDPAKRPSSAAEVIDRLAAIGGLDVEPLAGVAASRLLCSALVGRAREDHQLRRHLRRALRGEGNAVIIEGESGMGRARLASELTIHARIAGLTTLRIDALAHPEPGGTMRALARQLLDAAPLEAAAALPMHAEVLGRAPAELRTFAHPSTAAGRLPKDLAQRKAIVQRALVAWLLEVCTTRPLLLVMDDVHAVDSDSAGVLVLIAHAAPRAPLLLAVTQELDAHAPAPVQQLSRLAARVRLHGLQGEAVDALVRSVFGDVPHRPRLSQWLAAAGQGNPGHSLELLEQLVDRELIRYAGGSWVLPAALPVQELPRGVEEALNARLRSLGGAARQLALVFALHRGALPLQSCLELIPDQSAGALVAALDQLTGCGVLVRADDTYRIGREATRALLLRAAPAEEVRRGHARLAHALAKARPELFAAVQRLDTGMLSSQDLGLLLQAATHFARAGDPAKGREFMLVAAIELAMRGDGLSDAVPLLEAEIAENRAEGRPAYTLAPLLVTLTLAGTYSDFRLSYRYGIETLETLVDMAGLGWARLLKRWVGGRAALWLGLIAGFVRFRCTPRSEATRNFGELMLGVMGIGTALLGTFSVLLDREQARSVVDKLQMLRFFPRDHAVRWVNVLQRALLEFTLGDLASACEKAMSAFEALRDVRRVRGLREEARLQLQVGCLTPVSLAYGLRVDGKVHAVFEALDRLHTSVSRQIAAGARAAYYGHRGERARFIAHHEEMDSLASQAGSTWREDVGTPRQMWSTYLLCEDVLGLKRAAHELDPIAQTSASIRRVRDATRASYLCERGEPERALCEYGALFEAVISEAGMQGVRFAGAYARILRSAGEPARALRVCEQTLARLSAADRAFRVATFPVELELLLATAALGSLDEAAGRLDGFIAEQGDHDNPLMHGLVHKGRAQVALLQNDAPVFKKHLHEMEAWFRRTDNPTLIGQCQRLSEQAKRTGLLQPARTNESGEQRRLPDFGPISAAIEACRGPAERLRAALDLLLAESGADRGYLYLLEPAGLRFAAPLVGAEPPDSLRRALEERVVRLRRDPSYVLSGDAFEITNHEAEAGDLPGARSRVRYTPHLLAVAREFDLLVIGAAALVEETHALVKPAPSLLEGIARAIYAAGDVRTVYWDAREELITVRARSLR